MTWQKKVLIGMAVLTGLLEAIEGRTYNVPVSRPLVLVFYGAVVWLVVTA